MSVGNTGNQGVENLSFLFHGVWTPDRHCLDRKPSFLSGLLRTQRSDVAYFWYLKVLEHWLNQKISKTILPNLKITRT